MHTSHKDIGGANMKFFDRFEKREYAAINHGVTQTPDNKQSAGRRQLITKPFADGLTIDRSDIIDTSIDILANSKNAQTMALGRLQDKLILDALVAPTQNADAGGTDATTQRITATVDTTKKFKDMLFANRTAVKNSSITFSVGDIEYVTKIFADRDVESPVICVMNSELQLLLRQDADFFNAENRYAVATSSGSEINRGFPYRNITFVYCNTKRFPVISTSNLGIDALAANTLESDVKAYSRTLAVGGGGGEGLAALPISCRCTYGSRRSNL